ncbi:MAG: hypothetical protein LBI72_11845 [Flavobacteriaceae bacterium]|nr:hypothetical protein [Flavobacteriaceae bacterium]
MRKKVALLLLMGGVLTTSTIIAQTKKSDYPKGFRIGLGINGGISTNSAYDGTIGAEARLQYDLSQKTSITLSSGYTHLFSDEVGDKGIVPIKAGFKHFMNKNVYAMGELGAGIGTHTAQGNTLIWAPSIGYANNIIDVSLRYERYNDYNTDQLGIRVAYGFSLKNYNKKK